MGEVQIVLAAVSSLSVSGAIRGCRCQFVNRLCGSSGNEGGTRRVWADGTAK